eukprot:355127-Chlamydomonas_euryale.AAC.13
MTTRPPPSGDGRYVYICARRHCIQPHCARAALIDGSPRFLLISSHAGGNQEERTSPREAVLQVPRCDRRHDSDMIQGTSAHGGWTEAAWRRSAARRGSAVIS